MTNENLIFLKDRRYKELRLNVGLIARIPLMVQFYVRDLKELLSRVGRCYCSPSPLLKEVVDFHDFSQIDILAFFRIRILVQLLSASGSVNNFGYVCFTHDPYECLYWVYGQCYRSDWSINDILF